MTEGLCRQLCLVVGTPRGFTRSVVEALLKRGSKVLLTCSNKSVAFEEHKRLSDVYGPGQVFYSPCDQTDDSQLESLFIRALDTLGEIRLIVHSSANDPLQLQREDIQGDISKVNRKLDRFLLEQDVVGLKRLGHLATKYMGKHNGWAGGTLLNISSSTEVAGGPRVRGDCTVLGTVRALGLHSSVQRSGVKVCNLYQPGLHFSDTDLELKSREMREEREDHHHHSPSYIRDYTGYMALRLVDTAGPGTAWNFGPEMRLQQVGPADISSTCGLANKMCYWLGCPMVAEPSLDCAVSCGSQDFAKNKAQVENYLEEEEILDS